MELPPPAPREWLETDGLGGFACGTAELVRTRRYHGLLCAARTPPTGRVLLVAALDAEVDLGGGFRSLSAHRYRPGVVHPDGLARLARFEGEPCPRWTYRLEDGVELVASVAMLPGRAVTLVTWALSRPVPGARLRLRPLLALRDVHALEREREGLRLEPRTSAAGVSWEPAPGLAVAIATDGTYRHEPWWYRGFQVEEERARGYGFEEDLVSPGAIDIDLRNGETGVALSAETAGPSPFAAPGGVGARVLALLAAERARRAALAPLERAAEQYLVRRGEGRTIVAGYPWFTDWGRDTFLALRGLCLARGRVEDALSILSAWAGLVSEGMLPNRFVDDGEAPEFNSVDASLWFVVAAGETLARAGRAAAPETRARIEAAVRAILAGYAAGTRYGIALDADGLLRAGAPGCQLTWMDAKVDGEVITARIGKPVEVQALWAGALAVGARLEPRWEAPLDALRRAFVARFWDERRGFLCDVVDVDHVPGRDDATLRPNQLLAVGGLPVALLEGEPARRVVQACEERLLTPLGLRTLAPEHPAYRGRYEGGPLERDRAYHQGTVWPWLLGPFVEAWVRVRGGGDAARAEARARFLPPLLAHLAEAGLGHASEIADGDAPHAPRGAPFQAWSLGELLRLERDVLAPRASGVVHPPARRRAAGRGA